VVRVGPICLSNYLRRFGGVRLLNWPHRGGRSREALFRWALEILPIRNKLGEAQRATFDSAFLARADAIRADPQLLMPFAPSQFDGGPGHPGG
jgi:hypothetical protein